MPPGASDCSFKLAFPSDASLPVVSVLSKTTPTLNGVEEAVKEKKILKQVKRGEKSRQV